MKKLMAVCGALLVCAGCTSFEEVKQKADAGDAMMQYEVAVRYREGDGVAADKKLSEEYLKKAVESGSLAAAWDRIQQICSRKQLDSSAEFVKCCNMIFDPTKMNSEEKDAQREAALHIHRLGFAYLQLLVENKRDDAAYGVKKCLKKNISVENGYRKKFVAGFQRQLAGVKTAREVAEAKRIKAKKEAEARRIKAEKEAEAKRIAEEKKRAEEVKRQAEEKARQEKLAKLNDPKFKYPCGTPGTKLCKDIYAGISAQYLSQYFELKFEKDSEKRRKEYGDVTFHQKNAPGNETIVVGCEIELSNSAVKMEDIVEKYQREFPGIKCTVVDTKEKERREYIAAFKKRAERTDYRVFPGLIKQAAEEDADNYINRQDDWRIFTL